MFMENIMVWSQSQKKVEGLRVFVFRYLTPQFQWNTTRLDEKMDTDYYFTDTWEDYSDLFYKEYVSLEYLFVRPIS